jgi:phage terminase small subunit
VGKVVIKGTGLPKPPTEMQTMFVHHLVNNQLNATASARAAGYEHPNVMSQELLKNPKIQNLIAIEREKYAKASQMTKKKVIDGFSEAIDIARIKADPIAMVAGWREIAKICGLYEPTKTKIEVSVNGKIMVDRLNAMSDEDLLKLAEGDPSVIEGDFDVVDTGTT